VLEELALHNNDSKTHTNFPGMISQALLVRGEEEKRREGRRDGGTKGRRDEETEGR